VFARKLNGIVLELCLLWDEIQLSQIFLCLDSKRQIVLRSSAEAGHYAIELHWQEIATTEMRTTQKNAEWWRTAFHGFVENLPLVYAVVFKFQTAHYVTFPPCMCCEEKTFYQNLVGKRQSRPFPPRVTYDIRHTRKATIEQEPNKRTAEENSIFLLERKRTVFSEIVLYLYD